MIKGLALGLVLLAAGYFVVSYSAAILVANDPVPSDIILVLAGYGDESRFWHAVELMDRGYASHLILDIQASLGQFGVFDSELARAFVARNAPGRASVCENFADSTFGETVDVARCLQPFHASTVLIVTSAYHSRRALTIFKKRLPQYQWHVASVGVPIEPGRPWARTADEWWKNRRWAKTVLDEWEKWIWWLVVDRWRAYPVTTG